MQLTVMPARPTSAAKPRVNPIAAAFAAPYTAWLRSPLRPASDTIVTTRPHSALDHRAEERVGDVQDPDDVQAHAPGPTLRARFDERSAAPKP